MVYRPDLINLGMFSAQVSCNGRCGLVNRVTWSRSRNSSQLSSSMDHMTTLAGLAGSTCTQKRDDDSSGLWLPLQGERSRVEVLQGTVGTSAVVGDIVAKLVLLGNIRSCK